MQIFVAVDEFGRRLETFYHRGRRSPLNALVHMLAGLVAYHFYEAKPCVYLNPVQV